MDLTWLSAIVVGVGCLVLGYYIGSKYPPRILIKAKLAKSNESSKSGKKNKPKEPLEVENLADILDDFKMLILYLQLDSIRPVITLPLAIEVVVLLYLKEKTRRILQKTPIHGKSWSS